MRDLLAGRGVQEVITNRLTAPEREQRLLPPGAPQPAADYVTLLNPVAAERTVLRRALLASVSSRLTPTPWRARSRPAGA